MTERLSTALLEIQVQNNQFLIYSTTEAVAKLDDILPEPRSAVRQQLLKAVGESPLSDFVLEQLGAELQEKQEFQSEVPSTPLCSLPGYEDTEALATRLLSDFQSLPWRYLLMVSIPGAAADPVLGAFVDDRVPVSDSLSIKRWKESDAGVSHELPKENLFGFLTPYAAGLTAGSTYLCEQTEGYVGPYGVTTPLFDYSLKLRGLLGIALALRLWEPGGSRYATPRRKSIIVLRETDGQWQYQGTHHLSYEDTEGIDSLRLFSRVSELESPEQALFVRKDWAQVQIAFQSGRKGDAIVRAGQWLFDSYCGTNELLKFVQAAVSLEILLGDKAATDLVGLGELLANRCAYLIGKTRSQRDEILRDFRQIYETRSKIVHRGHSRLTNEDLERLSKLRWMCSRVIQEELRLLQAEADS
ncbi:hypothetical protein ACGF5M_00805 [Gemmatimonadota bacterium]